MSKDSEFQRGLLSYSSKDFNSILADFKSLVPSLTDLWRPEAEADPGYVLMKLLASAADMNSTNLDWQANEMYAPSVSQRKNAEKIFGLIGYTLGFYTAARTECTFTNVTTRQMTLDFGFNGSNFSTLNAYTDITGASRVITYNILPKTNKYGAKESRSRRSIIASEQNVFATDDKVTLKPGESVTRVAIEGELRSYSIDVASVKSNNYIIRLPSQHIDTTAVWIKVKSSLAADEFLGTQWQQCESPAEFTTPAPRFCVTYDNYSNAQIQVSNYLNQLENFENNYLVIYWIDCSGVIGCVGENVLTNLMIAKEGQQLTDTSSGDIAIANLSNTVELPHTNVMTGKSPETAREAYHNSRNFIGTFDSLVTLPDYERFLRREPGVDTGRVLDCQKALEINMEIYHDKNLTDAQKAKMYITKHDFPQGQPIYEWANVLNLGFDPTDPNQFVFSANFKTNTAMCFAIHNDFKPSNFGNGQVSRAQYKHGPMFTRYKPPAQFVDAVIADYMPLQAMSTQIEFGYLRLFNFYIVGTITPRKPLSKDTAEVLVNKVKEALRLYFAPANRELGAKPTLMEIVEVIEGADSSIRHFDPGASSVSGIVWSDCDPEAFNAISFARYVEPTNVVQTLRINPTYISG